MANWVADYLEQNPDVARLPIAARTRRGLHLRRAGRRRLALVTGAPMHYFESANRQWLPLDTRLQPLGDGSFGAPGLPFRLSMDGSIRLDGNAHRQKTWRVGVLEGGRFAETQRFGDGLIVGDRVVRQAGVFRHETILLPGGLREELTLIESPAIDARGGSLLVVESLLPNRGFPEGWVDEVARGGARFPRGCAQDAAGHRIPLMRWVHTQGGVQRLYSGVPFNWLQDLAYPVVIDPDIEITGETVDGTIEGSSASTSTTHDSAGSSVTSGARTFGGLPHVWRAYLKFDTSSLGPGASVEQVNLKMYPNTLEAYIAWTVYVRQYNWSANDPMVSATREAAWDGLLAAANEVVLANNANPVGTHVTSQPLPNNWVAIEGDTYYGLWNNMEGYAYPNNLGGFHHYSSANNATPIQRPVLMLEYLVGYPRSGPLPVRGLLPNPRVRLVDTRQKLRARSRRTALHTGIKDEG
ncbi:MAG: hypothetical protein WEA61_03645 [Anaerolineales bacterium]